MNLATSAATSEYWLLVYSSQRGLDLIAMACMNKKNKVCLYVKIIGILCYITRV